MNGDLPLADAGWPNTRFSQLVPTQHPIVQAPMANAGGVDLCIAAMRGGALGSLPCGMLSPEQLAEQLAEVRRSVDGPVNLNFLCHGEPRHADETAWIELLAPYYPEFDAVPAPDVPQRRPFGEAMCAAVEQLRPDVVSFHFGLPPQPLFDRVRAAVGVVIGCATSVDEARWLEARGVDAIVAQGFEAGGHSGRFLGADPAEALGLFALIPAVVDAVDVPVIGAGAIADGRGIAAAFALGASAVWIGTAYLHCPESLVSDAHRQGLRSRPTVMTNLFTGGLARALRGRLIDELGPVRSEAPPYPLATRALLPIFQAAQARGEFGFTPMLAGQAGPIGETLPADLLTAKLAAEALALMAPSRSG